MKIVLYFYLLISALCFLSVVTARSTVESKDAGKLIDSKLPTSSKTNDFAEIVTGVPEYCQNCDALLIGGVSGTFASPNFPVQYCNNLNCSYMIQVDPDKRIRLNFDGFATEPGYDYVSVYDGSSVNDPILLNKHYGNVPPPYYAIVSTYNQILVRFTTNEINTSYGWIATYITF